MLLMNWKGTVNKQRSGEPHNAAMAYMKYIVLHKYLKQMFYV